MATQITRWATILIVVVVVIIGGIIAILTATGSVNDADAKVTFESYLRSVGIALGLLGIGYGIDGASRP